MERTEISQNVRQRHTPFLQTEDGSRQSPKQIRKFFFFLFVTVGQLPSASSLLTAPLRPPDTSRVRPRSGKARRYSEPRSLHAHCIGCWRPKVTEESRHDS